MYTIEIAPAAERSLKKLPAEVLKRVIRSIRKLTEDPRPSGVKKLGGEEAIYRIRVGDYLVVYQIKDNVLVVVIVKVGHRRGVYR